MKAAEGRYHIECDQRQELSDQYSNCVIRAKRQGLVVYGGSDDRRFFGGEEQIREGATVRERQSIITIPDMTKMSVKVKIHESHIKKVRKGQKARIQVDAFPDEKLTGEVIKVGVLPDSGNRWMNPDLKVYITSVAVDGVREWLKPGMSAKVEILVKELPNVIYLPIQAVVPLNGKQYCFLPNGGKPTQREVEVGEFNDEFIEIKRGIKEGEKVLLSAPVGTQSDTGQPEDQAESGKPVPSGKALPGNTPTARPSSSGPSGPSSGPSQGTRPQRP
jgi:multidrug efflux pump subunit AcrA (membrane-fusion protein)